MRLLARSVARTLLHPPTVALRSADPESPEEYVAEDFVYVNSGSCLGMTGTGGRTVLDPQDDTPDQVSTPITP